MQRYSEDELKETDNAIASVQQNLFRRKPLPREEKSLQEKLYDLYIEECQKEPEAGQSRSKESLLDKLVRREAFACLVFNLNPGNLDFTIMIKDKDGSLSECIALPYKEEALLEYLDAEELPPFLLKILDNSEVNLVHHGYVIAEICDYRQCSNREQADCQSRHVLLKPSIQTLMDSMINDGPCWSQEEKFEVENQLLLATADPLCSGASFLGTSTTKSKLDNQQNMKKSGKWSSIGSPWPSVNWQQELPRFTAPPELEAKISCRKQAKQRRSYPYNLTFPIAGKCVDTWKQKSCDLDVPSHVDVQKYAKGKQSVPSGDSGKIACPAPEIKERPAWKPGCELKNVQPFVPENICAAKNSNQESLMSACNITSGNSSSFFIAKSEIDIDRAVGTCKKYVQSITTFSMFPKTSMPRGSSGLSKAYSGEMVNLPAASSVQRCPRPSHLAEQVNTFLTFKHEDLAPAPAPPPLTPPPSPALKPASLAQEPSAGIGRQNQPLPAAMLPASASKSVQATRSPINSGNLKASKVEEPEQKSPALVSGSVNGLVWTSGAPVPGQAPPPSGCVAPGVQPPHDQLDVKKPVTQLKLRFIVNHTSHPITVQIPSSGVTSNSEPKLYQLLPQQQMLQHPVPQASVEGASSQQDSQMQPAVVITVDGLGSFLLPQATLLEQSTPGHNIVLQNFQPSPSAQPQQGQVQAQSAQAGFRQTPFPNVTLAIENPQPPHSSQTAQRKERARKGTPTIPKP